MTSDRRDDSAEARKALADKITAAIAEAEALGLEYTAIVLRLALGTLDGTTRFPGPDAV